jgi:hypothetical protein
MAPRSQFHKVRAEERLSSIAALHGVPFQDIVAANPHKPLTRLESGEIVFASLAEGEDIALSPFAGEPSALGAAPMIPGAPGMRPFTQVKAPVGQSGCPAGFARVVRTNQGEFWVPQGYKNAPLQGGYSGGTPIVTVPMTGGKGVRPANDIAFDNVVNHANFGFFGLGNFMGESCKPVLYAAAQLVFARDFQYNKGPGDPVPGIQLAAGFNPGDPVPYSFWTMLNGKIFVTPGNIIYLSPGPGAKVFAQVLGGEEVPSDWLSKTPIMAKTQSAGRMFARAGTVAGADDDGDPSALGAAPGSSSSVFCGGGDGWQKALLGGRLEVCVRPAPSCPSGWEGLVAPTAARPNVPKGTACIVQGSYLTQEGQLLDTCPPGHPRNMFGGCGQVVVTPVGGGAGGGTQQAMRRMFSRAGTVTGFEGEDEG